MASKLVPVDPAKVMVIRDVVPKTITTLSTPFWRFGRIKIGGRGTIGMHQHATTKEDQLLMTLAVRLQNGTLAVFSPVALTDEVKQKVSEMGEVKYITALDFEVRLPSNSLYQNMFLTKTSAPHFSRPMACRIPQRRGDWPRRTPREAHSPER